MSENRIWKICNEAQISVSMRQLAGEVRASLKAIRGGYSLIAGAPT